MKHEFRFAADKDAKVVAEIQSKCWLDTYYSILDIDFLNELRTSDRTSKWENILASDRSKTILLLNNGVVIGFANWGLNRCNSIDVMFELYSLYILSNFHRKGFGNFAISKIKSIENQKNLLAWVLKGSPSVQFYDKIGINCNLDKQTKIGNDYYTLISYMI